MLFVSDCLSLDVKDKTMNIRARSLSLAVVLSVASCQLAPKYTQSQITAIETRMIEASLGETFIAASGALFYAGYTIAMSDREGGLITGTKPETSMGS